MKKVICALGLAVASVSSALATTYPLTIENCGYKETFTKAPERVVALGQNTVEILLLLGLEDKVKASAFWPTKAAAAGGTECQNQNAHRRNSYAGIYPCAKPRFCSCTIAAAARARK